MNKKLLCIVGIFAILALFAYTVDKIVFTKTVDDIALIELDTSTASTPTQNVKNEPAAEKPFVFISDRQGFPPAKIYIGYVIVEGEYSESYPEILGGGRVLFKIDEVYKTKIPKKYGECSQYFRFDNDAAVKQMLKIDNSVFNDKSVCELVGRAKIAIKDYTVELQESEVSDHANLAQIISSTPQVTKICTTDRS